MLHGLTRVRTVGFAHFFDGVKSIAHVSTHPRNAASSRGVLPCASGFKRNV